MAVWTVIDHQEMGDDEWEPSGSSTVVSWTKTGIPTDSTYDHLCLMVTGRTERSHHWDVNNLRFNGDSGSHYSSTFVGAVGSAPASWRNASRTRTDYSYWCANSAGALVHGQVCYWMPDYTNANTYRAIISHSGTPNTTAQMGYWFVGITGSVWTGSDGSSGEAIDEISMTGYNGDIIMKWSGVTLYGVKGS